MTFEPTTMRASRKPYRTPEFRMIMHHSRTQADMVAVPDVGGNPGMNTS